MTPDDRAALIAAGAAVAIAAGRWYLSARCPMDLPAFDSAPDAYAPYEPPAKCEPDPQPGVQAFARWVLGSIGGRSLGIVRECSGTASSHHHEGRAWDWAPPSAGAARALLDCLLTSDGEPHALLRRAGIRYIIYERRLWSAGPRHWRPYTKTDPHTGHVHFSFSWLGARGQTSLYELDEGGQINVRSIDAAELGELGDAPALPRTILAVRGIEHTSDRFRDEVLQLSARIDVNPDYLAAVMSFETGGTFDPAVRNPKSKAVGLIQFTKGTAADLDTTRDKLARLSAVGQLRYVERYLAPAKGRLRSATDHYMAVFAPKGIGKPPGFVLYTKPSNSYSMNVRLDTNRDGTITVVEAAAPTLAIVAAAEKRPRIVVPAQPSTADRLTPLIGGIALIAGGVWLEKKYRW